MGWTEYTLSQDKLVALHNVIILVHLKKYKKIQAVSGMLHVNWIVRIYELSATCKIKSLNKWIYNKNEVKRRQKLKFLGRGNERGAPLFDIAQFKAKLGMGATH